MLTDIQNWLLEVPLTSSWGFEIPFPFLFDGEDGGVSSLNLRFHGESRKTVAAALLDLYLDSYITLRYDRGNVSELLDDLNYPVSDLPRSNSYTLTDAGFALWEMRCEPMWELFVVSRESEPKQIIESRSLESGFAFLAASFPKLDTLELRKATEVVELRPWMPIRWRSFPKGFRLCLDLNQCEGDKEESGYSLHIAAETCWIKHSATLR
jgi:hypothetical protein